MYSILIVEDEKLVRQDLVYKVGKSGFPFSWIMEAENAEEALEIIRVSRPDILFTDVMMGEKAGLDLIEEVAEIAPKMVTVVISGYPDFSFAQRALKLHATDYLLKPVTPEQLARLLSKVFAEVEKRQNAGRLEVDNYVLSRKLESRSLQEQINELLSGTQSFDDAELRTLFPPEAALFQVQEIRMGIPPETELKDREALRFGLRNIAEELGGGRLVAVNGMLENEVIFVVSAAEPEEVAERELLALAKRIAHISVQNLQVSIDCGLSQLMPTISSAQFQTARYALDMRFSRPEQTGARVPTAAVYTLKQPLAEASGYHDSSFALYKRFLDSGDIKSAQSIVAEIFSAYRETPEPGIRNTYVEVIAALSRACYRKGVGVLPFLGYENISGSILNYFESHDELVRNLQNIILTAMGQWVQNMEDTADVLRQVKACIDKDFADSELCTNELARRFCISLGYLSASYKKAYGITISKYIIAQRMAYAAKLLAETALSVQQVSESAGFNNLSYFMRVFKTYNGTTPSKYRENAQKTAG